MILFKTDGHLTDEGLSALIQEQLNELQRLEVSEHLSFCDSCLTRYMQMMESAVLCEKTPDVLPAVKQRLRKKLVRFAAAKYSAAAAAVAFALIIGGGGLFYGSLASVPQNGADDERPNFIMSGLSFISSSITQMFNNNSVNVPKLPEVKVPEKPKLSVPENSDTAANQQNNSSPQAADDKASELKNPAKEAAQSKQNPAKDMAKKANSALDLLSPKTDTE